MTERQGVEIEYCPRCRGVRLDRGELDKIIERSKGLSGPGENSRQTGSRDQGQQRESIWSEIFDFDLFG